MNSVAAELIKFIKSVDSSTDIDAKDVRNTNSVLTKVLTSKYPMKNTALSPFLLKVLR